MAKRFLGSGSGSRSSGVSLFSSSSSVDVWTAEADAVSLPRLDEVGGQVRPSNIGRTYAEEEYRSLGEEQVAAWAAEGEQAARSHLVNARGCERPAAAVEALLALREEEVRQAQADHQHAARVLTPYIRRGPGEKWRYWIGWSLLVCGDSAGIMAAAVAFGDLPSTALGVSVAAGVAAGCSGLIGAEVKHLRNARARQRDAESLSEDEQRYRRLFSGAPDAGLGLVGLVGVVSLLVVVLVSLGLFLLRGSLEGAGAGMTYGCLAAATALGSFLLGYHTACEVADVLWVYRKRAVRAEARFRTLAGDTALRQRAEADAAARSVYAEHAARGQAAAKRVESLNWRIARNNPQVLGHGFPVEEPPGAIGRRLRHPNGHGEGWR